MERTHEIPDGTLPQPIIGRKKRFRELDGFRGIAAYSAPITKHSLPAGTSRIRSTYGSGASDAASAAAKTRRRSTASR